MEYKTLNGVKTYAPKSREELMHFAMSQKSILVAVNAEKILHATDTTRSIINRNVGYPDGTGAVWALQRKGQHNTVKIPGCELWLDIAKTFYSTKTFYLVGGQQSVIDTTVAKLQTDFPGIRIVNYRNGYIKTAQEQKELIQDIVEKKPDIIFVAMGSPKQELLMEEIQKQHSALFQGLGGSFDVYIGAVKRAPKWWVKNNLEWTYRLINQPTRIKRQIHLVRFFILLKLGQL